MKKPKITPGFFLVAEILLILVLLLLNFANTGTDGHWTRPAQVGSDSATFVMTATAHNVGLGVPYKDYWEIRPPGYYLMLDLWTHAFGIKAISFKFLEVLIRLLIAFQILLIARKIFSPFQAFIFSSLTIFVFFSPVFGALLYPEAYGIFFSLLGILSLLYIQKVSLKFFLAALFFSSAMQLKEAFSGAALALVPPLVSLLILGKYKSLLTGLAFLLAGFLLPPFLLFFYLTSLDAVNAYREVLQNKSSLYPINIWDGSLLRHYAGFFWNSKMFISVFPDQRLSVFRPLLLIFFIPFFKILISGLELKKHSLVLKIPRLSFSINFPSLSIVTILFYSIGSFFGPSLMQNISFHYVLSILIATYFFWAIAALLAANILGSWIKAIPKNWIFIFFVLVLLFPRKQIINAYRETPPNIFQSAYANIVLPEADLSLERYISEKTKKDDCILSVYGWKSSDAYLYSKRKPCTRFFIPNIVTADWQKDEYRSSILENPPQAIVYSLGMKDMDHLFFEQKVINIPKILENCYKQDPTYTYSYVSGKVAINLYFPIFPQEELKTCLAKNSR